MSISHISKVALEETVAMKRKSLILGAIDTDLVRESGR
jgi:hypothetical protein